MNVAGCFPSNGFAVLTLNLRFGLADDGVNSWRHRKKAFPAFFERFQPDFICVQEANDFQSDFLADLLSGYIVIGQRRPAPDFWQNNIIFCSRRWVPIRCCHFFLSDTPKIPSRFRESRWPRQCTMGLFRRASRDLICVNTHLDFHDTVQVRSAHLILKLLSDWPADVPAVLTGDFNTTPERPCYQVFTSSPSGAGAAGFRNVFNPPFPPTQHGFTGDANGVHIDWILYRGGITPGSHRVIRDRFDGFYLSDHFPVYACFRWDNDSSA
jgi:endonuclease/exonuclease/phosphatase family metal-dependent hydrolase